MKTIDRNKIKEAANNYVVSNFLEQCAMKQYIIDSFETGFELCEQVFKEKLRWIHVEEKEPEVKEKPYQLLCKSQNGDLHLIWITDIHPNFKSWRIRYNITEWRSFL